MTSILTNTSAMVALQTLSSINSDLNKAQDEISTGKSISSAKDNAAVWSISKVMESDVSAIDSIKSSLDLGESSVSVARSAAETVQSKLEEIQSLVISAQGENVDRATLQDQIDKLKESIDLSIGSAQFNGLNLIDGSSTSRVDVLASLNRDSSGSLSTSSIAVNRMSMDTAVATGTATGTATVGTATLANGSATATTSAVTIAGTYSAGDNVTVKIGDYTVSYSVTDADVSSGVAADTLAAIASGLNDRVNELGVEGLSSTVSAGVFTLKNTAADSYAVTAAVTEADGLKALEDLDVSTASNAVKAMAMITSYIDYATDVASYYGSTESQISDQADFMSTLSDAMTTGIGSLVDADMEEASARLTALQTQQQLGIQALSIANQQPQTILSLFQ